MARLLKRKSNLLFHVGAATLLTLALACSAHANEPSGRFVTGPRIGQGTAAGEPQTRAQTKAPDAVLCQDTLGLYLNMSTAKFESKVAATVLMETIARHETMERLILMATASGCEMRPFLDEEVRRNKH
jgi:hypothetical protein